MIFVMDVSDVISVSNVSKSEFEDYIVTFVEIIETAPKLSFKWHTNVKSPEGKLTEYELDSIKSVSSYYPLLDSIFIVCPLKNPYL